MKRGLIIAGVGIPGIGKSTIFKELSKIINGSILYSEPEEKNWPALIMNKDRIDKFSYITAFRNLRIQNYFDASEKRDSGSLVLIDSYFDKIAKFLLGKPGMEWLTPDSVYYKAIIEMAYADFVSLPEPDAFVFLNAEFSIWESLITKRNRQIDMQRNLKGTYSMQNQIYKALQNFRTPIVSYKLIHDKAGSNAAKIFEKLKTTLNDLGD